jgi:acyl carrier protein
MKEMNEINERQFIDEVAEIIEADPKSLSLASDFREKADFWSSLVGFALLVFMEERYGMELSVDKFIECRTIGDLYTLTRQ